MGTSFVYILILVALTTAFEEKSVKINEKGFISKLKEISQRTDDSYPHTQHEEKAHFGESVLSENSRFEHHKTDERLHKYFGQEDSHFGHHATDDYLHKHFGESESLEDTHFGNHKTDEHLHKHSEESESLEDTHYGHHKIKDNLHEQFGESESLEDTHSGHHSAEDHLHKHFGEGSEDLTHFGHHGHLEGSHVGDHSNNERLETAQRFSSELEKKHLLNERLNHENLHIGSFQTHFGAEGLNVPQLQASHVKHEEISQLNHKHLESHKDLENTGFNHRQYGNEPLISAERLETAQRFSSELEKKHLLNERLNHENLHIGSFQTHFGAEGLNVPHLKASDLKHEEISQLNHEHLESHKDLENSGFNHRQYGNEPLISAVGGGKLVQNHNQGIGNLNFGHLDYKPTESLYLVHEDSEEEHQKYEHQHSKHLTSHYVKQ